MNRSQRKSLNKRLSCVCKRGFIQATLPIHSMGLLFVELPRPLFLIWKKGESGSWTESWRICLSFESCCGEKTGGSTSTRTAYTASPASFSAESRSRSPSLEFECERAYPAPIFTSSFVWEGVIWQIEGEMEFEYRFPKPMDKPRGSINVLRTISGV